MARYGFECFTCDGVHDSSSEARECAHVAGVPGHSPEEVQRERWAQYQAQRRARGSVEMMRRDVEAMRRYFAWGGREAARFVEPIDEVLVLQSGDSVQVLRADLEDIRRFLTWRGGDDDSGRIFELIDNLLGPGD